MHVGHPKAWITLTFLLINFGSIPDGSKNCLSPFFVSTKFFLGCFGTDMIFWTALFVIKFFVVLTPITGFSSGFGTEGFDRSASGYANFSSENPKKKNWMLGKYRTFAIENLLINQCYTMRWTGYVDFSSGHPKKQNWKTEKPFCARTIACITDYCKSLKYSGNNNIAIIALCPCALF